MKRHIQTVVTRSSISITAALLLLVLAIAPLTQPAAAAPDPTDVPEFVATWGSSGSGESEFVSPSKVAIDSVGNVYVTDYGNNRIQKFTSDGTYLTQWGELGTGNGQFNGPRGIATDSDNNVYVVEESNNRIQKFTSDGTYLTQWGSAGTGNSQFSFPSNIAIDAQGNNYVIDGGNSRIKKFDSSGTYLTQWGSAGTGNSQFSSPIGIAVDRTGNIYVADTYNSRIQKFTSDGTYLTQWGSEGSADGELQYPWAIAVDPFDNVHVLDTSNNRIQKFTSDGTYLTQWGSIGSGQGEFFYAVGLAIDRMGVLFVADTDNSRIQKFSYPPEVADLSSTASGGALLLEAGAFSTFTCSTSVTEDSLIAADASKDYPLGLIDFCLDVAEGSTATISITFETSLAPDQVTARKYIPNSQTYMDVPDAQITETTLEGNPALLLTYDITDGGELDDDGLANGTILDPIGLAVDSEVAAELADSETAVLADTGSDNRLIQLAAITLLATPALFLIRRFNHNA